jgi:hypothetical protein
MAVLSGLQDFFYSPNDIIRLFLSILSEAKEIGKEIQVAFLFAYAEENDFSRGGRRHRLWCRTMDNRNLKG